MDAVPRPAPVAPAAPAPQERISRESGQASCPSGCPDRPASGGILTFLRGLIPRRIDADDLLIILLILLMNREEESDGLSPLLTLALYFLI